MGRYHTARHPETAVTTLGMLDALRGWHVGVLLKVGVRGDNSERGLVNTCLCGGGFNNALSGLSVADHRCTASAFRR